MSQWNLMSKSEAAEGVCFQQSRQKNDTLKIYFPRMNTTKL